MVPRIGITASSGTNGAQPAHLLNRSYVDAVALAGALPLVLPILDPAMAGVMLDGLDALLLSGGGDVDPGCYDQTAVAEVTGVDRSRDLWELELARMALKGELPTLAICRGAQVLNVACGGTLVQHLPAVTRLVHRDAEREQSLVHDVELDPASRLAALVSRTVVGTNTIHHQAVAEVGAGLKAVGWSEDGTIEAVESTTGRAIGVQWHPERLTTHETHRRLFEWLAGRVS
jgi:putative glutamine amidotransferase